MINMIDKFIKYVDIWELAHSFLSKFKDEALEMTMEAHDH